MDPDKSSDQQSDEKSHHKSECEVKHTQQMSSYKKPDSDATLDQNAVVISTEKCNQNSENNMEKKLDQNSNLNIDDKTYQSSNHNLLQNSDI